MPARPPPSTRADVQPHTLPWVIASSTSDSPAAIPAAPAQSTDPVEAGGRFGTIGTTTRITSTENAVVNQKTRW